MPMEMLVDILHVIAKGFGMEVYAFDPFVDSKKMKD